MNNWQIVQVTADAQALHSSDVDQLLALGSSTLDMPVARIANVDAPAIVLGRAQAVEQVVHGGPAIVRRLSGGGAVYVAPGAQLWVDLVIPRDDTRFDERVDVAFLWVGELWRNTLQDCGASDMAVHTGALEKKSHGDQVCFATIGPGEVVLGDGRKLVGISQRRTRQGVAFHCSIHETWNTEPYERWLGIGPESDLAEVAAGANELGLSLEEVLEALEGRIKGL